MTEVALGWIIYRLASALVDVAIAMDTWAYGRSQRPRAIRTFKTPAASSTAQWVGETRPLELVGGSAAGSHGTTPAAVPSPPPPPDTQPLRAVAAGTRGAGPVEGPARSRHTPRHASGRIRWPFMPPIGATP